VDYFRLPLEVYSALEKRLGKEVWAIMEEVNQEVNLKHGISKPARPSPSSVDYSSLMLERPSSNDYLPDDVTRFVQTVNLKELETLIDLRNIVSHQWKSELIISKKLRVPAASLVSHVRSLCISTINNLTGLKMK